MGTYTITINDRTNESKYLLALIREMSKHNKYIEIEEDRDLAIKMNRNRKGDFLSAAEQADFVAELKKDLL